MKNTGLIPADLQAKEDLIERLEDCLKTHHKGQGRAATSEILAGELYGLFVPRDAGRTIRDAVEQINDRGGLVCSSPACGFWWAESLDDGLPAVRKKLHRAEGQVVNAKKLEFNLCVAFPVLKESEE